MSNKIKSHKGLRKRIKITANGKIKRKRAFGGHLMSTKSGNRVRKLRNAGQMSPAMTKKTIAAVGGL